VKGHKGTAGVTRNANVLAPIGPEQGENRPFWYGPYGPVRLLHQRWRENRREEDWAPNQRPQGPDLILVFRVNLLSSRLIQVAPSLAQLPSQPRLGDLPFSPEQLRWLSRSQQLTGVLRAHVLDKCLASLSLSQADQVEARLSFCQENELKTDQDIDAFRRLNLLSDSDFQIVAERSLRLTRLVGRDFLPKAEARFLERKTSLDRVVYSLIRVDEQWLARELYLRIVEQEADFASLAAEFSQGPESKTRGVVGPVPMLQAHPILAGRLKASSPGFVHEPFRIDQWWLVVRMESYAPAVLDDGTRAAMAQELLEEWLQAEVSHWMSLLVPPSAELGSTPDLP